MSKAPQRIRGDYTPAKVRAMADHHRQTRPDCAATCLAPDREYWELHVTESKSNPEDPECEQCNWTREYAVSVKNPFFVPPVYEVAAVPNRLRFQVLKRDGFTCQYCGKQPRNGAILEVDHVLPVSRGGQTVMANLRTACKHCNSGKSNIPLKHGSAAASAPGGQREG